MAYRNSKKRLSTVCGLLVLSSLSLSMASAQQYDAAGNDITRGEPGSGSPAPALPSPPPIPGCQAGNLQTLATASLSEGGAPPDYGAELGNDGVFGPGGDLPSADCSGEGGGDWTWISAGVYPTSAWYELQWPSPVTICQIFVDTKGLPEECFSNPNRGLHGADVETWDGANWVAQGSVTNATDDWGFVLPSCVTTTRLRLNRVGVVSTDSQASNPVLYELKVYDCEARPSILEIPTLGNLGFLSLALGIGAAGVGWLRRRRT